MTNDTTSVTAIPQLSVFLGENESKPSQRPLSSADVIGPELMGAFESATGWTLRFQPVPEKSTSPCQVENDRKSSPEGRELHPLGVVEVDDMSAHLVKDERPIARTRADRLAESLSNLIGDRQLLRRKASNSRRPSSHGELWALAPVEPAKFAKLMQQLLRSVTQAADCQRAAFYLLDDRSEFLELGGEIGLGPWAVNERLLSTSPADIEALTGHAIVISEPIQSRIWAAPEDCYSAICVPVASPKNVLGTLWVFSDDARKFSDTLVNQIEIVAGRIAAELERESALAKLIAYRKLDDIDALDGAETSAGLANHNTAAEVSAESFEQFDSEATSGGQTCAVDPPFDGWEFRGSTCETADQSVDWLVTDDEQIQLALGCCDDVRWSHAFATIDPLTGEVMLQDSVSGGQFWTLDWETLDLKPIVDREAVLFLKDGQSLIATFCDDQKEVRDWIEATMDEFATDPSDTNLMLMLSRGQL